MREGDREIGYAWIDVEHQEGPKESTTAPPDEFMKELAQLMAKYGAPTATGELDVTTGKLTLEQSNLIYQHLPVDISYVDEDELVASIPTQTTASSREAKMSSAEKWPTVTHDPAFIL